MGITLCLGLTPQLSSNWEKRSCLWRPPSSAAVMPFPLISLSSPYALPLFCSPAMQVSPTLSATKSAGEPEKCGEC